MLSLEQLFSGGKNLVQGGIKSLEELFGSPQASQGLKTTTPMMTTQGTSGSIGKALVQGANALNDARNRLGEMTRPDNFGDAVTEGAMGATGPMAVAGVARRVGTPLARAAKDYSYRLPYINNAIKVAENALTKASPKEHKQIANSIKELMKEKLQIMNKRPLK